MTQSYPVKKRGGKDRAFVWLDEAFADRFGIDKTAAEAFTAGIEDAQVETISAGIDGAPAEAIAKITTTHSVF